jgi:hypothetical protein
VLTDYHRITDAFELEGAIAKDLSEGKVDVSYILTDLILELRKLTALHDGNLGSIFHPTCDVGRR